MFNGDVPTRGDNFASLRRFLVHLSNIKQQLSSNGSIKFIQKYSHLCHVLEHTDSFNLLI